MKLIRLALSSLMAFSSSASAYEIDSFTNRYAFPLKNMSPFVDEHVNQLLSSALSNIQKSDPTICSQNLDTKKLRKLYKVLEDTLIRPPTRSDNISTVDYVAGKKSVHLNSTVTLDLFNNYRDHFDTLTQIPVNQSIYSVPTFQKPGTCALQRSRLVSTRGSFGGSLESIGDKVEQISNLAFGNQLENESAAALLSNGRMQGLVGLQALLYIDPSNSNPINDRRITEDQLPGYKVGVDKITHFFSKGYELFEATGVEDKDGRIDESALKVISDFVQKDETRTYGLETTGVYSYGDIAANIMGFIFWKNLFLSEQPYFACEEGRLTKKREFAIKDYINESWDEGVNCSIYLEPTAPKEIQSYLGKIKKTSQDVIDNLNGLLTQYQNNWTSLAKFLVSKESPLDPALKNQLQLNFLAAIKTNADKTLPIADMLNFLGRHANSTGMCPVSKTKCQQLESNIQRTLNAQGLSEAHAGFLSKLMRSGVDCENGSNATAVNYTCSPIWSQ